MGNPIGYAQVPGVDQDSQLQITALEHAGYAPAAGRRWSPSEPFRRYRINKARYPVAHDRTQTSGFDPVADARPWGHVRHHR